MAEVAVAAVSYITGLTGTAAAVATTAAVAVAATSAVAILSQQPEAPNAQGQLTSLNLASNAARRLQIGKRGNGGSLVDWYTYGDKNQFAELVVYLGEGPMGDLTGIWSSGRKVYSGTLTHGNRVQLTEFDSPDGRAWIEYYDGRPGQTASSRLVSATSGAWASSNVGEGCAYAIISLRWDPDTMPAIASFFVETEGAKLYDRRLDSTAGGSGSHRLKDPSTWEVSSNPAVALDHYLLGRYRDASSEPTFGVGLDPSLVNYSRFATMANLCDEDVAVTQTQWYTTTQPRYEANGIILSTDSYKDTILNLCRSMNARAADLGGELGVIDNEAKTAVIDLEDKDVAPKATEIYIEKKSRDDLIGGVRGNYQDPDNNYNPTDYPSYTDSAWETEDGSILEYDTLDLDFETDPERAQRLAKMHALRARRQASLQGAYNMKALILEDGDWFTRTTEKFPSGKTFEVIGSPVLDTSTMTVKINAIEVDTSDTAWNAATDPRPVVAPVASSSGLPPQLGSANISIQPTTYVSPGGMELPAIEVRNLAYDDEIPEALEVEVALDAGDGSPLDDAQTVYMPAGREYGTLAPLLPDTDYLLRTRRVLNERSSGWTVWSSFTTTANYTVESIANQGWGATASEGEARNTLAAGGENSPIPDFNYQDAGFWNLPSGVGFDEQSGIWGTSAPRRSLVISPGTYDFYSEYFDIEPDSTYEVIVRYWNGFGTFSGYVSPQIHIPFVAFWGIVNGASANGADERITAPGTAGTIKRTVTFSGGTSRVQFRTEASFTGPANFYIRYELRKIPKWSQVQDDGARPEDNADVTGDHTALAVVGQGALATANAASVRKVTTSISGNGDDLVIGSGSVVGNVWHQAASITLNTDAGGSVETTFNCHFDGIAGGAQNMTNAPYATVVARVKRGSTVIATGIRIARVVCDSSGEVDPWSGSSFTVVDNSPGGGSVTYSVELRVEDADPKSPTSTICELLTGRGEFMKCASYPSDANDFA